VNHRISNLTHENEKFKDLVRGVQHDLSVRETKLSDLEDKFMKFKTNMTEEMIDNITKKTDVLEYEFRPMM
jgi:predicted  nucleic acid-binding Zn-ribbon protein